MKKLNQAMIIEAIPQETEYYLSDHQIKGLTCRILPSGVKTYYLRYTSPIDKKRKKIKIEDAKILKLEEARSAAMERIIEIKKGNDPLIKSQDTQIETTKPLTLGDFWPKYEKEYIIRNHKPSTVKNNASRIRAVLEFFGHMQLDKIKPSDVNDFKNANLYESSFTKSLSYLKCAFRYAEILGFIPVGSNPCLNITGFASNKIERYLTDDELSKLVNYIETRIKEGKRNSYPYYALLCLIYTGQRKNEIVKLKWEDIDFKQETAILHDSKVGKRTFNLNQKAISIFKQIPKQEDNEYIFCGTFQNSHIRSIDDVWEKLRIKLDLEDVRIHDLRHSFASFAINNGVDLYDISKLLGHRSINTTQRYAHLSKERLSRSNNQIFK